MLCLVAVFLPSFLLVIGVLPFWDDLRQRRATQATLRGITAAVVGLLIAAFYNPDVDRSGILGKGDFALAAVAFLLLDDVANPALAGGVDLRRRGQVFWRRCHERHRGDFITESETPIVMGIMRRHNISWT